MARAVVTEDYYSLLEVSQFASLATIRESYKKLALKFHPDKNKGETATSDFQRLAIAWETLKDPGKRAEYDRNYVGIAKRKHREGEDSGGKRRSLTIIRGLIVHGKRSQTWLRHRTRTRKQIPMRPIVVRKSRLGKQWLGKTIRLVFRHGQSSGKITWSKLVRLSA